LDKPLRKIIRFFKLIWTRLARINDSPQRIALGFGLGVFTGVMPFAGPIAALFLATVFRVNRASALMGSLITNTWFSVVTLGLSVHIGSALTGLNWKDVYGEWTTLVKNNQWRHLLSESGIIAVVIAGYLIVSLAVAAIAYAAGLIIVKYAKGKGKLNGRR
jgi:uncharacterized protein (DUF2062 family)